MELLVESNSGNSQIIELGKKEKSFQTVAEKITPVLTNLYPVDPLSNGFGPPYAPADWPNIGDKWKWSVGSRIKATGNFQDRYLFPPASLQKPSDNRSYLAGKSRVERYIQTVFPETDLHSFMASFSWEIPSKVNVETKETSVSPGTHVAQRVKVKKNESDREAKTRVFSGRKLKVAAGKEVCNENVASTWKRKPTKELPSTSIQRRKTRQSYKCRFPTNKNKEPVFLDLSQQSSSEETNSSINHESADVKPTQTSLPKPDVLKPEHICDDNSNSIVHEKTCITSSEVDDDSIENKLESARRKLAVILTLEFNNLIAVENLSELAKVISFIKNNDVTISAEELLKLHKLGEIPLLARCFAEARKQMEDELNKFNVVQDIATMIPLLDSWNESKHRATRLLADLDTVSMKKTKLEKQICMLQARHAVFLHDMDLKERRHKVMLSEQQKKEQSISMIMEKIVVGSSSTHGLEAKKNETTRQVNDIITKFNSPF